MPKTSFSTSQVAMRYWQEENPEKAETCGVSVYRPLRPNAEVMLKMEL